jgi:multiple sugar transport system substrate-binding protein
MVQEQRDVLDDIIVKIRAGRMKRRTFLERAMAVGLSSTAAMTLLEACGGTSNSTGGNGQTTNVTWQSEHDPSGTYQYLVNAFNKKNTGVHVTYTNGPTDTGQLLTIFTTMLRARGNSYDIMSMDIIWPPEFGTNGWTAPITDSQWPASERANYLPGPLQGCTFNEKLWAAPLRTDTGLLYYRTDLVKTPPNTWNDMATMAKSLAPSKVKYGYLWQGAQYEGVVCDFVEVLYGYGGNVLDPNDPKKVIVNSPEAQQALTEMVSWVGTISPGAVTTMKEEDARSSWQNGDSVFMRNWPYAYSLGQVASSSKIVGKYDVHPMLYGGSNTTGHSNIGGWQLGINAFSRQPDAAWTFIKYMLSSEAQKYSAINQSVLSTLQSVYTDSEVLSKVPFFAKMPDIVKNALPRPVSPAYPDITNAIQQRIHAALTKQVTVSAALSGLQSDLQAIVSK